LAKGTALYERNDFKGAFAVYSQAAGLGHPRAMAVLGNMYREGESVPKDPRQAVKWYTQAATRGNRGAQYLLGSMYEEGEGVPRNVANAAQLYEASARQGMPEAQFALGLSYEFAEGVPRNRRTAIYWLDQVAGRATDARNGTRIGSAELTHRNSATKPSWASTRQARCAKGLPRR
jgi:hypothetical protein